jgi:ribonuclease J
MHGTHAKMTDDFVKAARESKPIALITEGTRIDIEESNESEQKVFNESKKKISKNNRLSIIDFNFKDVDRFSTFYKIAKNLDKKLVISFKHSCFLEKYYKDKKLKIPNINDEQILILKPKRLTGTYIDEDYTDNYIKKRLNYPNITTSEELKKNPSKYMVVLNFWYFNMFVDLKPKGGVYIHSLSEPFNEEMEITYKRMINWINFFDLNFFQSHCSGHIFGRHLKEIINEINPKILFPIHTEKPGKFRKLSMKSIMVKYGKSYKI